MFKQLLSRLEPIITTIFIYVFGQVLGGVVLVIALTLFGWESERITSWFADEILGQFSIIAIIEIFTLGLLAIIMRMRRQTLTSLGLKGAPHVTDFIRVAAGYAVYLVSFVATIIVTSALIPSLNTDQQQQIGFEGAMGRNLAFVFVSLVILPPIIEELLTRGFLYTNLKKQMSKRWAVLVTSGLFAVAHLQIGSGKPLLWAAAIDTFILSIILIELKERSDGRLWAPIGLHMLKNLVAFTALFVLHLA